jgi:signal transduction protein with GAF and PtsI domain
MYPMISGVAEVVQANDILRQVMRDLKNRSWPSTNRYRSGQ